MTYDFASLSPFEFENLVRDLVGAHIGERFEAFAEGPDDGMDGRHVRGGKSTILQAKHYLRSGFSGLKSTMTKERASIDRLQSGRYILATSAPLTPANKRTLATVIGLALQGAADIFGPDDLNALLRSHPHIEKAHPQLWTGSTAMLETVLTGVVEKALAKPGPVPAVLAKLLPTASGSPEAEQKEEAARDMIFVIKASMDDAFALWLAPKLEAEGYRVFADILTLQPGDRWRREINLALQNRAAKVLFLARDATLDDSDVQDDLDIALEVGKALADSRFIIPLRMATGRKVKGLGDAVAVDFVRGWGEGLASLLEALQRQKVPRSSDKVIDPNWEIFRRRGAIPLTEEPERLTSNWLRVVEAPDTIRYFESSGVVDRNALKRNVAAFPYPAILQAAGFLTFADQAEVDAAFGQAGRFKVKHDIPLQDFVSGGFSKLGVDRQTASNHIVAMFKTAWYQFCKANGFLEYQYSNAIGFHAAPEQVAIRQLIPWGRQGKPRSSMLRNVAKGHIWQFGVTAAPSLWPFWHFKLKSRVLFSLDNATPTGLAIDDPKKMHRLRRSICKGWRNKQWLGRMLAFLELLSGESAFIRLALSPSSAVVLEAAPVLFSSPVSTMLPDILDADDEETDLSTLGRPEPEEVEA
jgi:hypothetical protein